jgi:hypothetical protein
MIGVPEEQVCIDLFRQNPVFTSLHFKSPVHVVPPLAGEGGVGRFFTLISSLYVLFGQDIIYGQVITAEFKLDATTFAGGGGEL